MQQCPQINNSYQSLTQLTSKPQQRIISLRRAFKLTSLTAIILYQIGWDGGTKGEVRYNMGAQIQCGASNEREA